MTTLALALVLAATDPDLPRVLGDDVAPPAITQFYDLPAWSLEPQAARGQHRPLTWAIGGHLGVASSFDSDDAAFDIGGQARLMYLLPWLSLEGSIDIQTEQSYENGDIHIFLFPVQFTALFYPPVDWPVRPYGLAGIGIYYEDIRFSGALSYKRNNTAIEPGFHVGFGADYALPSTPNIVLNADLRFVFLSHPGGLQGNDLDYMQFTVGVNFILQ
jgi:hypothetical protein